MVRSLPEELQNHLDYCRDVITDFKAGRAKRADIALSLEKNASMMNEVDHHSMFHKADVLAELKSYELMFKTWLNQSDDDWPKPDLPTYRL